MWGCPMLGSVETPDMFMVHMSKRVKGVVGGGVLTGAASRIWRGAASADATRDRTTVVFMVG